MVQQSRDLFKRGTLVPFLVHPITFSQKNRRVVKQVLLYNVWLRNSYSSLYFVQQKVSYLLVKVTFA